MRPARALLFLATSGVVACGGFLGFGEDDDVNQPPPNEEASTTAEGGGNGGDASNVDPPDETPVKEAGADTSFSDDAAIDVEDNTPVDAGPGVLVYATFEQNLETGDGADEAFNMARTKTDAISGQSAVTAGGRPSILAWTFGPQTHVYVSFSLRILTLPKDLAAELVRVTATGNAIHLLVGKDGTLVLRADGANAGSGTKMQVGGLYRIGLEADSSSTTARAGVATLGNVPPLTQTTTWTPASVDAVHIRTADPDFTYLVDDVVVSDKGVQ